MEKMNEDGWEVFVRSRDEEEMAGWQDDSMVGELLYQRNKLLDGIKGGEE